MADENGAQEARQIQMAPIDVNLNGCQFAVGERPDGMKVLQFVHQSGILVFTAVMSSEAASNLARMLTGIQIATVTGFVPQNMPVMKVPKSRGH